jgi:hypothetical protein
VRRLLVPAGWLALGAALAGAAFYGWQRYFSRDAEIRAIHASCVKEIADAGPRIKGGLGGAQPEAADSFGKRATDTLGRWLDGMSGGMSDAVCGTIRDACTTDYDGRVCAAARERYR